MNTQQTEKLLFYNHTECECQIPEEKSHADIVPYNYQYHHQDEQPLAQQLMASTPPTPVCTCPNKFSVRRLPDNSCICDCFHLQKDCLKLKKGKDNFTYEDQLCIKNSTCLVPSCEYGRYLAEKARCVRKLEMFTYWPNSKYSVQDSEPK